ncbi:MAG: DUF805 domain-containing protein, partial [Gemmatimonadaceae bacterium]
MNWYIVALKKYAVWDGRARRTEYWMFTLISTLIYIGLTIISSRAGWLDRHGESPLVLLYQFGIALPTVAVGVRRMHDLGKSAWWLLFPVVNFFLTIMEGDHGSNEYGDDPKGAADQ